MKDIDIERLKRDIEDYYTAGSFCGTPAMIIEAWDTHYKSDDDIIDYAIKKGFDIDKYRI